MAELKFEIKEHIGTVSESSKGWTKELNIVSWNGANPKFDLRDWAPEHEKMGKGLTFTNEELKNLRDILIDMNLFALIVNRSVSIIVDNKNKK